MTGGTKLADLLRSKRARRNWTQTQLAKAARVSIDAVRRCENGTYTLPTRPRTRGHILDSIARALGLEPCEVVSKCFSQAEVLTSDYRRCLDTDEAGPSEDRRPKLKAGKSFRAYVSSLPLQAEDLVSDAAMLNAQAIAFLINLEKQFSAFEFLITNQPPFMLFADDEYITTGAASLQLDERDREAYHDIVFAHRAYVRDLTERSLKHYRVVLHKQSLIAFLNARSSTRAADIVDDVKQFLHYDGFDLVVVESREPFDELEILSRSYPFRFGVDQGAISIRHRRVGLGNTAVYQLALVGSNHELVSEDHARAEALWKEGLAQAEEQPRAATDRTRYSHSLKHKRVAAYLLDNALSIAHP